MLRPNRKGFAGVEALLILVVIAIIGGTGYFVYQSQKKTNDTLNSASKSASVTKTKKKTAVKDATSDWTSYTSTDGKYSLKYPSSWATATHPELCSPGILLLGPDAESVGKCASDALGQISVASTSGDYRSSYDYSKQAGFTINKKTNVTVDKVSGTRVEATAGEGQTALLGSYPNGTKAVAYIFYTNGYTYAAAYTQEPTGALSKDVLGDFDQMITKTLKFN